MATTTAAAAIVEPSTVIEVGDVDGDRRVEVDRSVGQAVGELSGDGLHAGGGNRGVAVGEHPKDDVEHPAAVGEVGIELDAADEGAEEPFDDRVGEPGIGERLAGRGVVALEETDRVHAAQAMAQPCDASLVEW